jgi:hypothetical protein
MMEIPASLRRWFVAHAIVDLLVALPLLIAPVATLRQLGWTAVDPVTTRLVAAALLAIGGQSYLGRQGSLESYRSLLNLKMLWSSTAIVALLLGIGSGAPVACWGFLAVFVIFFGVWTYYRIRIKQWDSADSRGLPD